MSPDTYKPERDVTPSFVSTVRNWIEKTGEVLVIMRFLRAAGAKDYAIVTSAEKVDRLVDVCPIGTDIIVFRDRMLPMRGVVDNAFVKLVQESLPEDLEYLFVKMKPEKSGDPRCFGQCGYVRHLDSDLEDMDGQTIAIGECPNFSGPDDEAMISASKGGIDGPR
jgi:hypothetical protein